MKHSNDNCVSVLVKDQLMIWTSCGIVAIARQLQTWASAEIVSERQRCIRTVQETGRVRAGHMIVDAGTADVWHTVWG